VLAGEHTNAGQGSVPGLRVVCFWISLVVLLLLSSMPAQAQKHSDIENIGKRDINKGSWNVYSLEREIELGRQLAADAERTSVLFVDREVNAYIRALTERLVRNSDARVPFAVKIIDSDEISAFALPGGHLYINTGLILETHSEAELAGILAHEIAHVTARHAVEQATKAQVFNWLALPLIFIGGPVGYALQQAVGIAVPLAFLKFSRNAEREADFLGLQYTYKAGYDPVAMVDFLERLKQKEKGRVPAIFSSHPMTKNRIQRAAQAIAKVLPAREEYVVTTSDFEYIQKRLLELRGWESIYQFEEAEGPMLRRRSESKLR